MVELSQATAILVPEPAGFDTDEPGHTVVKVHQAVRNLVGLSPSTGSKTG